MLQLAAILREPPSTFQVPEAAQHAIIEVAVQVEISRLSQENFVSLSTESSRSNSYRKVSMMVCFAVQMGESIICEFNFCCTLFPNCTLRIFH